MSRIDTPEDGDIVPIGTIEVAGVAFAGTRGVSKVEYSTDGGSHWSVAQFDARLSRRLHAEGADDRRGGRAPGLSGIAELPQRIEGLPHGPRQRDRLSKRRA